MAAAWKLSGYVVEDLLGSGGTGDVWRARVVASGDAVALKRIPMTDPEQLRTALKEAAMLSVLDHPHLVRLHGLVPTSQAAVLVLDLAAGGSLADVLHRRGRLTPAEAVSAVAPIGAALAYAHSAGVVHGDVSPANILLSGAGQPVLADLGVARIVGDRAPVRSTPGYLDPAVAAGSPPGTPSDVFMLAAVAVHALTGSPLWPDEDHSTACAAAASGELDAVAPRLADLPDPLVTVLSRALVVQPHLRCTAAEFALDLRHCIAPAPIDLDAGRDRTVIPRPRAVPTRGAGYAGQHRTQPQTPPAPGRPAFDRPGPSTDDVGRDPLTQSIRAALRPVLPPPRRRIRSVVRGRLVLAIIVSLIAAAIGWQIVRSAHRHESAHAVAGAPQRPSGASPARRLAADATTAEATTADATGADAMAAAELRALDRLRGRAFADNQPALLAQVYQPGPLLAQDTAALARSVPTGCSLQGVRTSYSGVRATPHGDRLLVDAVATLAPSVLLCAGARSGTGAGEGPARLDIELVRTGSGLRIAVQRRI